MAQMSGMSFSSGGISFIELVTALLRASTDLKTLCVYAIFLWYITTKTILNLFYLCIYTDFSWFMQFKPTQFRNREILKSKNLKSDIL
jgi:hypothetical protein